MGKYNKREQFEGTFPKVKEFGGKRYELHSATFSKRGALKEVKELRRKGYYARLVGWALGFVVYKRKRRG